MTRNLDTTGTAGRQVAVGALRAFLTVLVVAHHAVLAYHPQAPPPPRSLLSPPMFWLAFPVVDSRRWPGIDLLVGFNDAFFMSAMFFLSGLFVWQGLRQKGPGRFLRDRIRRLGLPFVVASALLAPLAYAAAYAQTGADPSLASFCRQWLSLPLWPSGPAWFLWVLLVFDVAAAALFRWAPGKDRVPGFSERLPARIRRLGPAAFFALLVGLSALAYVPLVLVFGPHRWFTLGPFSVQASRPLHYAVYFFVGVAVGAGGVDRGLLAPGASLARHWLRLGLAALAAFSLTTVVLQVTLSRLARGLPPGLIVRTAVGFGFVLSCATSTVAFLALFLRFARAGGIFDRLSGNAYGIYLVHYLFVCWLQFALLSAPLPGALKGSLVVLAALAASWGVTTALRKAPGVARVI